MLNLYDFDKTIYDGDSTIDFYKFMLKNNIKIIKYFPRQVLSIIKYKLGKITKEQMKETFFLFLKDFNNTEDLINTFWQKNIKKIKKWYLNMNHDNDIIISASPEFLIKPIGKILNTKDVIASKNNIKTGKYDGKNCFGKQKVKRFKEKYKTEEVLNAYSDSLSDMPMLELAKNKYLVNKNKIKKI